MTAASVSRNIESIRDGRRSSAADVIAVEAPLELRANGAPKTLLMRTPGHDRDLTLGLLHGEGIFRRGEALPRVSLGNRENVIEVDMPEAMVQARWPDRGLYANSACGVCGRTSIEQLAAWLEPTRAPLTAPVNVIASLPETLHGAQRTFHSTGGLHAAGLFTPAGHLAVVREDVGRHNAVDKVIGWALVQGVSPSAHLLCVSGRASYEIVQKAAVAGIGIVVAVSAPSSLAVDLAERFQITLCGFTRDKRFNIYSHGTRVTD